jgi:AcrR family transcriptional regulator
MAMNDQPRPRTQSRAVRRAQIIEATIETIAARSLSRTTLTEVARTAGLSHGLVLFHFQTKEQLLAETLGHLAEEYRQNWLTALEAAGPDPISRLMAVVTANFAPSVCTPTRIAAWCGFWSEAPIRPIYLQVYGDKDDEYGAMVERLCADLLQERGLGHDPARVARIIRVSIEGLWIDMMSPPQPYDRDEALATARLAVDLCFRT